jgi:polysaccharide biosynthesis transport protein
MTQPKVPEPQPAVRPALAPRATMDLRTVYHALLEKLWLILLCFVISAVFTAAHLQRAPRIYAATATLQVEQQEEKVVKFEKVQQEDLRFLDMLQTIAQTISSRPVLERVVQEHNLTQLFTSPQGIEPSKDEAVSMLGKMVDVRLRRGTRLLDVTVASTNPGLCEKLANSIIKQYIRFGFEQQSASSQIASEFLLEEAQRLKKKLQESEGKLQAYKEEVKSISLEDRHDIITSRLKELSQRVNEAKIARTRIEVDYAQVQALGTNVHDLLILPAVANDATIANISMTLSKLQNEFSNLQQRYKEKHPKYIQAQGQVKDWGDTLTNAVLKIAQTIQATYENAKNGESALDKSLHEQEALAMELSKQGVQYNVLQREIESDRTLYDSVLTRLKETTMTKDLQADKVRILQFATTPRQPISPNTQKVLMMGLVGGLAIGIALVLGIRSLDTTMKTVDQVEEALHLPVVTAIQYLPEVRNPKKQLVVQEHAQSSGAEAFRSLRTAVSMLGRQEARRTLLFTSAVPQEGKTFCSVNFALCLAQAGLRTLMIDLDLRRPSVERTLTGKRGETAGVTDFLTGQKPLSEIIQATQNANLFYISAGTTAPNPAELLAQGGFAGLLEEVLRKCDRVVVDSAPIHAVSDTLLLVDHVQTVLVVMRAGKTPWKATSKAVDSLRKAGAPIGGIVLNGIKVPKFGHYGYDTYYYYSYHKGYGHKGVYGEGKKKEKAVATV